jgi:hypothetical protein
LAPSDRESLQALISTAQAQLGEDEERRRLSLERAEGEQAAFAGEHALKLKEADEALGKGVESLTSAVGDAKKRMMALEETYDKLLALKSPVDYWTDRQQLHHQRANYFAKMAIASAAIGGVLLSIMTYAFVYTEKATGQDKIAYWAIGVLALSVTLFMWVIRAEARMLFANAHLELDAGERRVMALTYLSLHREGALAKNSEALTKVLNGLFRHSSSGLIRDDAGPSTPLDIATRIVTGK